MSQRWFLLPAVALICSCSDLSLHRNPASAVLIVGNSITEHLPNPSLGWYGDWGMAASTQQSDFAHLSSAALKLPLTIISATLAEGNPQNYGSPVVQQMSSAVTPRTLVVIELGDNVQQPAELAAFMPLYQQMTQVASKGAGLICLSTFWDFTATDQAMEGSCRAHGGTFIYIGDIYQDPANPDYQGAPVYSNITVDHHPHNWSMQQISDRVIQAAELEVVPETDMPGAGRQE